MFQRDQVEKLLSLNGVTTEASDDEIKSVLLSARWHKDDIEAAVLVLRENKVTHQTHVDSMHKVFRSDERMHPETVSALLGIEMNVMPSDMPSGERRVERGMTSKQMMTVAVVSLALSLMFVLAAMWHLEMGMFHQTLR